MNPLLRARSSESYANALWRLLVRIALVVVLVYSCYRLRNIITTLFIAAIIAYVLDPLVEWLSSRDAFVSAHTALANWLAGFRASYRRSIQRRETPPPTRIRLHRHAVRVYATLYIFVLSVVLLWQGTQLVISPFAQEIRKATSPAGQKNLSDNWERFRVRYDAQAPDYAKSEKIIEAVKNSNIQKTMQTAAGEMGKQVLLSLKNVVEIVLLPVLAFYFLIDGRKLKHEFVSLLPRRNLREALRMTREFNQIMRAFIAGQFILCLLAGVVVGLGLALIGVPFPFTLGLLAGLTRAIPIVGPIIGGIPIIVLTLVTKGTGASLAVLGFFTFMHFAESKFIMPMLIGDRMELHPVIIIVVLIVGGEIGGVLMGGQTGALLGMFFAAPLAAIVRVAIRRYWLHISPRPRRNVPPTSPTQSVGMAPKTTASILPEPNEL